MLSPLVRIDLERDALDLPAVRLGQKAARLVRLRQRQGRAARAEGEEGGRSHLGVPGIGGSAPLEVFPGVAGLRRAGGRSEIRTHGGLAPTAVFKTAALNHSAILPSDCNYLRFFNARHIGQPYPLPICYRTPRFLSMAARIPASTFMGRAFPPGPPAATRRIRMAAHSCYDRLNPSQPPAQKIAAVGDTQ